MRFDEFNAQRQPKFSWPAKDLVARAYLDQLGRTNGLAADRIAAVKSALDKKDRGQLTTLAGELESAAGSASGRDAERLRGLAAAIKGAASGD